MFNGVPEQFHQFIASRTSLPILPHNHLSYPNIHGSSSSNTFDIYPSHQLQQPLQPHFVHPLDVQPSHINKDDHKQEISNLVSINMEFERPQERPVREPIWSNNEILALLKIGSTMENWYPDINWEHVSRKLAQMGFKRSAEKCKEKFEEESRYFNSISTYGKNCRLYGALEELCHGENPHQVAAENHRETQIDNIDQKEDSMNKLEDKTKIIKENAKEKKRKRKQKFDMFKSFCEDIVSKFLAQQEEMHNKLIEDMVRREEEIIAREEAIKKEEMDRMNQELEIIAQEQAIAGDRQAKITEYLNKITASNPVKHCPQWRNNEDQLPRKKLHKTSSTSTLAKVNASPLSHANSTSSTMNNHMSFASHENPSSTLASSIPRFSQEPPSENPTAQNIPLLAHTSSSMRKDSRKNDKDEIGKRWPRDEVLALINLRCHVNNEDKGGGSTKVPIWERISQGMMEFGYKRSAKRCKEKWENINKYFRKNRDGNKKRPLDSRTCPYFHQLSSLYNRGKLVASFEEAENPPELNVDSSQGGPSDQPTMHAVEAAGKKKNMVQISGFDFEY